MANSVIWICEYAFKNCSSLKNITFSEKVEYIGKFAFSGCKSLESVYLPKNLESLSRHVFEYCESLKVVELPSGIENIYMGTFKGCTSLEKISIPEGVEKIEITAFLDCVNLKKITLPASLKVIENCFYNCHNITDIYYNGGKNTWNNIQIDVSNTSFTTAKIHYAYKYVSDNAKIDNNNIIVADSNKYIGKNVLCVFMKENKFVKIEKDVFKNGKAEFKKNNECDEIRVYVYDKLTSPKFDFYEKIKL